MKFYKNFLIVIICSLISGNIFAQDFGFGFDNDDNDLSASGNIGSTTGGGSAINFSVGGKVSASMIGYIDDFNKGTVSVNLGDIFSGRLNFAAETSIAEGIINLKIEPSEPELIKIDEAYARAFLGNFDITAGIRKLTWGKADSMGPLDVINPLDTSIIYTEMADNSGLLGVKIARPLIHASFRLGDFSKLEGVFVPNFEPHYIPTEGRWTPAQMKMLADIPETITMPPLPMEIPLTAHHIKPDTDSLNYFQAGLRFTTTVSSSDIGIQYYYGRKHQPAVEIVAVPQIPTNVDVYLNYKYNPYHQIGIDYAQVLFGFNIRAEAAVNITEDTKGDDGSIYNPNIAWSLGLDRSLFWGINLNIQANQSIMLFHDKLGSDDFMSVMTEGFDIEGGMSLTSTRVNFLISKKFFRDELELRTAFIWGVEDKDCLIMPAIIWTKDNLRFTLAGGFFFGDSEGQLGQYKDNGFVKISMSYSF